MMPCYLSSATHMVTWIEFLAPGSWLLASALANGHPSTDHCEQLRSEAAGRISVFTSQLNEVLGEVAQQYCLGKSCF